MEMITPPKPMAVQPIDYMGTGQVVSQGIEKIGSGLAEAGNAIAGAYKRSEFKKYQATAMNELKTKYGLEELVPAQYVTPDAFMSGLKNLGRVMAAYDTAKELDNGVILPPREKVATAAFYGGDDAATKVESSMFQHLTDENKKIAQQKVNAVTAEVTKAFSGATSAAGAYQEGAKLADKDMSQEMQTEMRTGVTKYLDADANRANKLKIAQENARAKTKAAYARAGKDATDQIWKAIGVIGTIGKGISDIEGRKQSILQNTEAEKAKLSRDTKFNMLDAEGQKASLDALDAFAQDAINDLDGAISRQQEIYNNAMSAFGKTFPSRAPKPKPEEPKPGQVKKVGGFTVEVE